MGGSKTHRAIRRLWRWVLFAIAMLVVCMPRVALAKSYQVDGVEIDATIGADGTLAVTERRTYVFDGSYNGIFWDVPRGSYRGREIAASVESVGVAEAEELVAFAPLQASGKGTSATYELAEESDYLRLKLYWPAEDESVTFEVRYRLTNLATRWSDTAELYWQYVPADEASDVEWRNVTATLHLPVPAGEPVRPGENVRAWGHGPFDGEVDFAGNDPVFFSPGVGAGEYLEAHVTFPAVWLSEVRPSDEARLETILAEEDAWATVANEQRRRARRITYGIPGFLGLAGLATFLAALIRKKGLFKRRKHTSAFQEKYYRDVPTNDHPAVLGMLYRHGNAGRDDLTASIMRLCDIGSVRLDTVMLAETAKHSRATDRKPACRLSYTPGGADRSGNMRAGTAQIDKATIDFLFKTVAGHVKQTDALRGQAGQPYVLSSHFGQLADDSPSIYEGGYHKWEAAVRSAYQKRGFEKSAHMEGGIYPGILGLLDFALFAVVGLLGGMLGVPNGYLLPAMGICFVAGLYCVWNSDEKRVVAYSDEADEILAKLEALKRWLTDFTRLEEAIPTDVVLWNRLLLMATVFGIADEVVKRLRVVMPQMLEEDEFVGSAWFGPVNEKGFMPADALAGGLQAASNEVNSRLHSVSTSGAASSRDSSSRGSGGGFSGGGGGGFSGGGGRGGAF